MGRPGASLTGVRSARIPNLSPSTPCELPNWPRSSPPRKAPTQARAAMLALWHDAQETRTGDLPHSVQGYLPKPDARQITADQTAAVPTASRAMIGEAVDEFETGETAEAVCARDADRLEMLFQAIEYRDIGVQRVDGWIESARKGHQDRGRPEDRRGRCHRRAHFNLV